MKLLLKTVQAKSKFLFLFVVTRIQFYAVEIARNRRQLNKLHLPKQSPVEDESQER
jgi:hypothetical protein